MPPDRPNESGNVVFFYFMHKCRDGIERTNSRSMFRAILTQLLNQDHETLEYMQKECGSLGKTDVLEESFLKGLVEHCLKIQRKVWVVLDGLDECDEWLEKGARVSESRRIIEWFQEAVLSSSASPTCSIRLLILAQRDGVIEKALSKFPSISLDAETPHLKDIEQYSKARAALIRERFSLEPDEVATIVRKVVKESKGIAPLQPASFGFHYSSTNASC
jgi:hypothetical protein